MKNEKFGTTIRKPGSQDKRFLVSWFPNSFFILPLALVLSAARVGFAAPETNRSPEAVALAMLQNIQENGFNSDARVNGGLGGLWINWRTGSKPLLVNFKDSPPPSQNASN